MHPLATFTYTEPRNTIRREKAPHRTSKQLLPHKLHTDASPMRDGVTRC
jgi:hypothetical protein